VRVLLQKGIEINGESSVFLGDHQMDALRILGNPNKEYHRDGKLLLNYLELGLDVEIRDCTVSKLIMHTNFPYHPNFCFYNRCNFEIELSD
jgi:hypothetical protein